MIHRGRGNNQSLVASCPHWFRFLYARIVIPTDINMGGTTSTKMPLRSPWIICAPAEAAWV